MLVWRLKIFDLLWFQSISHIYIFSCSLSSTWVRMRVYFQNTGDRFSCAILDRLLLLTLCLMWSPQSKILNINCFRAGFVFEIYYHSDMSMEVWYFHMKEQLEYTQYWRCSAGKVVVLRSVDQSPACPHHNLSLWKTFNFKLSPIYSSGWTSS